MQQRSVKGWLTAFQTECAGISGIGGHRLWKLPGIQHFTQMFIRLLQVLLEEITGIHPNPETEDGFEVWLNIPENFKAKVKFCGKIITVTKQNGEYL